ncbi:MAG: FAD-dependent oxidoreductase [Dongiaceae bacterium]
MAGGFRAKAEVLIVGGGIAGVSVAYHLGRLGIADVVLCERKRLTCGTTWHAAGLVTQLRATRNMTELAKYTGELFRELEAETGQATGFRQNGSVRLARSEERFIELKRGASMARNFGLPVEVLGPAEIAERYPPVSLDGILGGLWMERDGQVDPVGATLALAAGARRAGVTIVEELRVERILVEHGRAVGALTDQGEIRAGKVVICGGMWSREIGGLAGAALPLHAAEHFYVVTEPLPGLPRDLPVLFVSDEQSYYKEDAGKLLLGCMELVAKPWGHRGIPADFAFDSLPEDVEHFAPILEMATRRVPLLAGAGIKLFFCGPESFTPDNRYLLGETAEIDGLYCACGFNSIGIMSSGGIGRTLAQWIRDGHPPADMGDVDVRRVMPFQTNRKYLHDRTVESLGLLAGLHWPHRQYATARGVRQSPFHDRLVAAGAVMTELAGWERPGFFGPPGAPPAIAFSWRRPSFFDAVGAECRLAGARVALLDASSLVKIAVDGRDALAALQRLSTADLDVPVGRVRRTQWLNERGGVEADVTVTRLGETGFLVVTGPASQVRDLAWLRRRLPAEAHVFARDVTAGLPLLALVGPGSRALLESLSDAAFSDDAFPRGASREIEIGYARVRASRVEATGLPGWELLIPAECAAHVFDTVVAAGAAHGLGHLGHFAAGALRVEAGRPLWGAELGADDTPLAAGLDGGIAWDKPGGFVGREALLRLREAGPPHRRLVQVRMSRADAPPLFRAEPIWRAGRRVGAITSGAWGHRLGASLGMGYVAAAEPIDDDWLAAGPLEVEVAWERHPAQARLEPWPAPPG